VRRTLRRLPPLSETVGRDRRPLVSVLMSVYNEIDTVERAIDEVLAVEVDGVDLELVIVESSSTDGSREVVQRYAGCPRTTVVLQDEARGKGNAVRASFRVARGDIYLIQDADLEYDVRDYPALLAPILDGTADFVLGTRYQRGTPMRQIPDAKALSRTLNLGHRMFATLFNVVFRARLRDPFTMYKVFRSPAIDGLEFVSDRFDFDYELVAKLLRSGYEPYEVPVRYEARGFHGGKKIRMVRDPITWVVACARFRFTRLRPQVRDEPG
jgi:glycosyltransferase involved in cell wall biosynthesis